MPNLRKWEKFFQNKPTQCWTLFVTYDFNKFCCQTELVLKEPSNSVCITYRLNDLVFLQMGLSPQVDAGNLNYRSKTRGEVLAEEMEVRLPDTQLQRAGAHPSISCSTPNQGNGVPGENHHGYKENMYISHGTTELEVNPEPSALTLRKQKKHNSRSYDSQLNSVIQFTGIRQDCLQVL